MFAMEMNLHAGNFYVDGFKVERVVMDDDNPRIVVEVLFEGIEYDKTNVDEAKINEVFAKGFNIVPREVAEGNRKGVLVTGVYKKATDTQVRAIFEGVDFLNDVERELIAVQGELANMNEDDRGFKVRQKKVEILKGKLRKRFDF